jgi:hypothetical protein
VAWKRMARPTKDHDVELGGRGGNGSRAQRRIGISSKGSSGRGASCSTFIVSSARVELPTAHEVGKPESELLHCFSHPSSASDSLCLRQEHSMGHRQPASPFEKRIGKGLEE